MSKFTSDNYVEFLAKETKPEFSFKAKNKNELQKWQSEFRAKLINYLGLPNIEKRGNCELMPNKISEVVCDGYIREEWTIQTEADFLLPFFLLRPLKQEKPLPLVLTPHGHGKLGKATYAGLWYSENEKKEMSEGERDIALQAVNAGYIAIAPDMRAFASMRRKYDRDRDGTSSCRTNQMHALLFGRTLVGERVWDMGRLIDYANTRNEIDCSRIMITGNSGGGTISVFAAAVDTRITVAVPSCYYCTFEHSIGIIAHCECNYVPGIMNLGEMYDVAGLIAPRPFLAVAGRHDDIFPIQWVEYAYEKLKEIYKVCDATDACQLYIGEGGHRYYKKDVWPFAKKYL